MIVVCTFESVNLFTMKTKSIALLKLDAAALDLAGVWVELSMGVDMLSQVLLLRKLPLALVALEPLVVLVDCQEMPFEAKPRGKLFPTIF